MDIRIKGTDYTVGQDVQEYLASRLGGIEKLLGNDASNARCEVELGRDAGRPRHGDHVYFCEIQIFFGHGEHVRATNKAASINAAIDDVKEEVERQLRKAKKAHVRFLRKSGAALKRLMRFSGQ